MTKRTLPRTTSDNKISNSLFVSKNVCQPCVPLHVPELTFPTNISCWAVLLDFFLYYFNSFKALQKRQKKSDDVDEVKIKYHQRQSSVSLLSSSFYSCCCLCSSLWESEARIFLVFFLSFSFNSTMLLCCEWRDESKLIENVQERVTNF